MIRGIRFGDWSEILEYLGGIETTADGQGIELSGTQILEYLGGIETS